MKHLFSILMLSIALVGCRPLTGTTMQEQGVPEPEADWSKNRRQKQIDELPTGTSDRAREIERSLGLGR